MNDMQQKLAAARGEIPADVVFRNARIVNVLSGEIHDGDVAVMEGMIAGIGAYEGKTVIDCGGSFLAPGLIDGHIHLESTMLTAREFARAVVPHGTAGAVVDPHEFANVLGLAGIDYVLDAAAELPLELFVMMPSCVPATHLESSGARITPVEILEYVRKDGIAGVAELMNFPGVFLGMDSELAKIDTAKGKAVDGHSPGLVGPNLNAYIMAGVRSDHECTTLEEAREKLRRGMHILLREGTAERNLHDLLPLITKDNAAQFSFATDDKHPADLEDEGHIDHHVREAIRFGIDPMTALQIASINSARHYRLQHDGAIAPGRWANFIIFDDLNDFRVRDVYYHGNLVARDGEMLHRYDDAPDLSSMTDTMHVGEFELEHLYVYDVPHSDIKVIDLVPGQIITTAATETPLRKNGLITADTSRDILKLAVIERHHATGNIGKGFVRGFGLQHGALASTVAHDAHNIIVVGTNDRDMYMAALELVRMGGGQCVVRDARVVEELPLPIAGLVSDQPLHHVRQKVDDLIKAAQGLGCTLPDPFMTLSFLALSPIPALKVTDQGLVDAEAFELTSLFTVAQ
ncbi:MAG: adenine deaminase [Ignavibacteria bacterium]|nr:MAG: adenine deaminase [Ignavibacteria bacterium]